jgi:hypothetical protein
LQHLEVLYSSIPFMVGMSQALFERVSPDMLKDISAVHVNSLIKEQQMNVRGTLPKMPHAFGKLYQAMNRVLLKRPVRNRNQLNMLQNEKFDCWLRETKEDFLSLRVLFLRTICDTLKYIPSSFKYNENETIDGVFSIGTFITRSTIDHGDTRVFFNELIATQHFTDWIMKSYYYLTPQGVKRTKWAEKGDSSFIKALLNCYSIDSPIILSIEKQSLRDDIYACDFNLHSLNKQNKIDMDDILDAQSSNELITDLVPEYVLYRCISSKRVAKPVAGSTAKMSMLSESPTNYRASCRFSSFSLHSPKAVQQKLIDISDCPDQSLIFDLSSMRNFRAAVLSPSYSPASEHITENDSLSDIDEVEQSVPRSPMLADEIMKECHQFADFI